MATITTIASGDNISDSRTDINNNFANLNSDKIETSYIDTDTTLSANSDTKIASQKAVKAYADSVASPTGASWNDYVVATSGTDDYAISVSGFTAYTAGQTFKFKADVANTGACTLNINSVGAKNIYRNVNNDLSTGDILINQVVTVTYDGTNFQLVSNVMPDILPEARGGSGGSSISENIFPPQEIGFNSTSTSYSSFHSHSSTDGSILLIAVYSSSTIYLYKFLRNTTTNNYYYVGTVSSIAPNYNGADFGMCILGNYIYYTYTTTGGVDTMKRFNLDFSGSATTMTVSGTFAKGDSWTDGTDLYITTSGSGSSFTKFTISGTTATNAGTTSFTSGDSSFGVFSTSNYVYMYDNINLRKYNFTGGSVLSTTTFFAPIYNAYYPAIAGKIFLINSNLFGYVYRIENYTSSAKVGDSIKLVNGTKLP